MYFGADWGLILANELPLLCVKSNSRRRAFPDIIQHHLGGITLAAKQPQKKAKHKTGRLCV